MAEEKLPPIPVTPILTQAIGTLLSLLGGKLPEDVNHLDAMVSLKRVEKAVEQAGKTILPEANVEFARHDTEEPLDFWHSARVQRFTRNPITTWPQHIQDREDELKLLKQQALANGEAKRAPAEVDPKIHRTFAVKVTLKIDESDRGELRRAANELRRPETAALPAAPTA